MQKPYIAGTTTVADGETDEEVLTKIFGADFLSNLKGAPSNIVFRYDRNISYRLADITNDPIASLNLANSLSGTVFNDIQTWWTDTLKVPTIYVTNASGATCNIYVEIYANRFK